MLVVIMDAEVLVAVIEIWSNIQVICGVRRDIANVVGRISNRAYDGVVIMLMTLNLAPSGK
jgi:hypothetical protein